MAALHPFRQKKARYGIKNVKSQVLQTYAENGKNGLEEFMEVNIW